MSASNLLAAYPYPEVLATARPAFTPAQLLDGSAPTLYITASSRHQRLLAPVIVALAPACSNKPSKPPQPGGATRPAAAGAARRDRQLRPASGPPRPSIPARLARGADRDGVAVTRAGARSLRRGDRNDHGRLDLQALHGTGHPTRRRAATSTGCSANSQSTSTTTARSGQRPRPRSSSNSTARVRSSSLVSSPWRSCGLIPTGAYGTSAGSRAPEPPIPRHPRSWVSRLLSSIPRSDSEGSPSGRVPCHAKRSNSRRGSQRAAPQDFMICSSSFLTNSQA